MPRRLIIRFTVIAVAVAGVVVYGAWRSHPSQDANLPLKASSHQVDASAYHAPRQKIAALGRLTPESRIIAIGMPSHERLDRLLVEEGQHVKKGDILAYLESHAERLAETRYAESQLRDARERFAAETAYGRASLAEAEIRIRQVKELPRLEIRAQEAKLRELKAALLLDEKDLKRLKDLRQRNMTSQQEVEHQSLRVSRAREALNRTQAGLAKLKAEYEVNLLMAQAQLKTAQANLVRAQAAIRIESLKQNLQRVQTRLQHSVLRAPMTGRILQIFTQPGETGGTQPLLNMANTEQMYTIAEVYETDIGLVRVGQRAKVLSPALSDVLTGTVVHIGSIIAKNDLLSVDPAALTDARVIEVKIQLDHSPPAARLINLQVDVEISLHDTADHDTVAQQQ